MMAIAGVILAILAPYETSNIPFIVARFIYWVGLVSFATLVTAPTARFILPYFEKRAWPLWTVFIAFSGCVSVPVFGIVIFSDLLMTNFFFNPEGFSLSYILSHLLNVPYGPLGYLMWYGQVVIITMLLVGSISLIIDKTSKPKEQAAMPSPGYRFINRLPSPLGSSLICLTMEDHYVRAYTDKGSTLILMRFSDAMEELADFPGMQIHRSWWIATAAIEKVKKNKRRYMVYLKNGLEAPVSQRHQEKLREHKYIK